MIRNLVLLLEIFTFLYGFAAVYGKKLKYEIYDVVFIIADLVLLIGVNEQSIPKGFVNLTYVLMCIYCMKKYHASFKKVVVNLFIVCTCITVCQAVCYSPIGNLFKLHIDNHELLLSVIVLFVVLLLGKRMWLQKVSDIILKKKILLIFVGGFLCGIWGIQIWNIRKTGTINAANYVLIIYFVILLSVIICEWQKTKTEAEVEKAQLEMNMLYYEAYEGLIQSIREKQHDFKNHITTISGMLYGDMDNEAIVANQKEYFKEVLGEFKETTLLTMIENPSLSGFIIHKCNEAERMGIAVEQHCAFTSQTLKVPEYKLVEMMGILYDNAIEATPKGETGRKIWIRLWKEDKMFCFSIRNCYVGERIAEDNLRVGYSSKGGGRGIGLAKLNKLLAENEGRICLKHGQESGYKTIEFAIYVPI